MKAEVLQQLFTGRDVADLDDTARAFAGDVLRDHLRGEALERADWHRTQGHRLVIVSASLAVYLRPIAEQLRFDAVLATELEKRAAGEPKVLEAISKFRELCEDGSSVLGEITVPDDDDADEEPEDEKESK